MPRRTDVIELAVLGVLEDSPMHGYHLRKHVTALLGPWRAALSFGTLYPTLRRLQADGYVSAEGTRATATKVVYRVTEPGRARFRQLLGHPGASLSDDDAFGVRFSFFARLDPADRLRVLEQRRVRLLDRLDDVAARGCEDPTGSRDPYRSAWAQRGVASVESELRWTEARLAAERAGADTTPGTG
ncbi:PadR family transcriptional regulator [Aquipuribacter hungaricus]|uniref:PadR family transcriptional regulator n=1 Tax=Aquipuribacter hungaricus TaxID=545624 RepID=A0ABV7WI64_9MICO